MEKLRSKIEWTDWAPDAFERARRENKPILLRLSAVWCHWCHVQDSTSDQDERVISRAHERFVPVRVDIDRRPDIRERYNFGGYPTSVFLTPDGDVIAGGTYIPPDDYVKAMDYVEKIFKEGGAKHDEAHEHAHTHAADHEHEVGSAGGQRRFPKREPPTELDPSFITGHVMGSIRQSYDPVYGGFGTQPKFPMPDTIEFLLDRHEETGEARPLQIAAETVRKMRGSALWDTVELGFFRYSVTADWSEPHYEKMLEVNAGLLLNAAHLYAATGERSFAETARGVIDYSNAKLWHPEAKGYVGSQDADEEYYKSNAAGRKNMKEPYIDTTVYADLDAKMISALFAAYAYCAFEDAKIRAVEAAAALRKNFTAKDGGLYHFYAGGKAQLPGLLSDQVFGAKAFLDAYEATGDVDDLEQATALADHFTKTFGHKDGGLVDRVAHPGEPGLLKTPVKNLFENAAAAKVLIKLAEIGGREDHRETARRSLVSLSEDFEKYGFHAADYARAVRLLEGPRVKLVVVGREGDAATEKLREAAVRSRHPAKVLEHLDLDADVREVADRKYAGPAVYVCSGTACAAPITDIDRATDDIAAAIAALGR